MKDPVQLARVLNQIQANTDQATLGARTNPITGGGVLLKGISFTAGVAKLVRHTLGRAAQGAIVTNYTTSSSVAGFGVLYNQNGDNASVTVAPGGGFVQAPQTNAGASAGTTLTTGASGSITVTQAGTYAIAFTATVSCGNTFDIGFAMFVNGSQAADITGLTHLVAGIGNQFQVSLTGVRALNAGDALDVRFETITAAGGVISLVTSNLSVQAIGGGGGFTISEAALPPGFDSSLAVNLVPPATGTADVMVF